MNRRATVALLAGASLAAALIIACSAKEDYPPADDPRPRLALDGAVPGATNNNGDSGGSSGSLTPTCGAANTMSLNGDDLPDKRDYISPGNKTFASSAWRFRGTATTPRGDAGTRAVQITVDPADGGGSGYYLDFRTEKLGRDLTPGSYTGAQRAPFADDGHPGLSVSSPGRGCNRLNGLFTVHSISVQEDAGLTGFSASFEQHCEEGEAALRGCIDFRQ